MHKFENLNDSSFDIYELIFFINIKTNRNINYVQLKLAKMIQI